MHFGPLGPTPTKGIVVTPSLCGQMPKARLGVIHNTRTFTELTSFAPSAYAARGTEFQSE